MGRKIIEIRIRLLEYINTPIFDSARIIRGLPNGSLEKVLEWAFYRCQKFSKFRQFWLKKWETCLIDFDKGASYSLYLGCAREIFLP